MKREKLLAILQKASETFRYCSSHTKILGTLAWGPEVHDQFFADGEAKLPNPQYAVDHATLTPCLDALRQLKAEISGEHPVFEWLERTRSSFESGVQLLLNLEKPEFNRFSVELYGGANTSVGRGKTTCWELATAILGNVSGCSVNDVSEASAFASAQDFADALERRLAARVPQLPVRVELSSKISAKIAASQNRIRIREGARFTQIELRSLWNHEVESHCLTGLNGGLQPYCPFLAGGGPRTTRTQEGLAVFYEMFGHSMSQERFIRLCYRVEGIRLVEQGADFIELYRWFRDRTEHKSEAFFDAHRIFRGAPLKGGFPFTKDIVYIPGLLEVYQFLQAAVRVQDRLLVESLVAGRISLEDVGVISSLRLNGILQPPAYLPEWMRSWESLVSFFSFFSVVLTSVDMSAFQTYFDEIRDVQDWKVTP